MVDASNPKILGFVSKIKELLNNKADGNHTHGNVTNDGKVGTAANKPLITGTNGVVQAGSFGTDANTFCQGNDSRLSDKRNPLTTRIPASQSSTNDLNDWTVAGFYYSSSDGDAKYISNLPESKNGFFLLVEDWGQSKYTKQTVTHYMSNNTYTRMRLNNRWTPWQQLQKSIYVQSTHTTATHQWTGTCSLHQLNAGEIIYYHLLQDPTSSSVTLNLTLENGNTTGAKGVYTTAGFGNDHLTNEYKKNSIIPLCYYNGAWVVLGYNHIHKVSDIIDFPTSMPPTSHTHASSMIVEASALTNIGLTANATQQEVNSAINQKIGEAITYINQ